jgi:hypothetical protein
MPDNDPDVLVDFLCLRCSAVLSERDLERQRLTGRLLCCVCLAREMREAEKMAEASGREAWASDALACVALGMWAVAVLLLAYLK